LSISGDRYKDCAFVHCSIRISFLAVSSQTFSLIHSNKAEIRSASIFHEALDDSSLCFSNFFASSSSFDS
jgi:hypothetical protein